MKKFFEWIFKTSVTVMCVKYGISQETKKKFLNSCGLETEKDKNKMPS